MGFLEKIQNLMKDLQCESEQVNDRIIFMSMYNDIVWREEGNTEKCVTNSITLAKCARRFPRGRWSFLRPRSEKKLYGTHYFDKPDGNCGRTAEMMLSGFERGELRSKAHGKKSIHFNGSEEHLELLLRTIIFCKSAQCLRE